MAAASAAPTGSDTGHLNQKQKEIADQMVGVGSPEQSDMLNESKEQEDIPVININS